MCHCPTPGNTNWTPWSLMHRPGLGLFTNSLPHELYVFIVFSLSKVTADGCAMQAVTYLLCDRLLDLSISSKSVQSSPSLFTYIFIGSPIGIILSPSPSLCYFNFDHSFLTWVPNFIKVQYKVLLKLTLQDFVFIKMSGIWDIVPLIDSWQ